VHQVESTNAVALWFLLSQYGNHSMLTVGMMVHRGREHQARPVSLQQEASLLCTLPVWHSHEKPAIATSMRAVRGDIAFNDGFMARLLVTEKFSWKVKRDDGSMLELK